MSITITRDKDLSRMNTFGLTSKASTFIEVQNGEDFEYAFDEMPYLLGGGSNVILPEYIQRPVLHWSDEEIKVRDMTEDDVVLEVGAGMNWHRLVSYCVRRGLGGLENLALIPGAVGAAPVQNIGAYGVELSDRLVDVEVVDLKTNALHVYTADECELAYRHSRFKLPEHSHELITRVSFRLSRKDHEVITHYESLAARCSTLNIKRPTIADVYDMVIAIRRSKLPDPADIGNCGSFFKNPILSRARLEDLLDRDAQMKYYTVDDDYVKLAAGYLIDQCGWRGKSLGPVGCYEKQALVLVNHGGATQTDVLRIVTAIKTDVMSRYGVQLDEEVRMWQEGSD